jgi:hypothetical protein
MQSTTHVLRDVGRDAFICGTSEFTASILYWFSACSSGVHLYSRRSAAPTMKWSGRSACGDHAIFGVFVLVICE